MDRVRAFLKSVGYAILCYLPVILLWRYVPSDGGASDEQYVDAFRLFFFLAAAHLVFFTLRREPFDRLAMTNDVWIIICGALAWMKSWGALGYFAGELRGTGVWVIAVPLGLLAAYLSKHGVIGAEQGEPVRIRHYSFIIVGAMAVTLVASYFVRESVFLSVVGPTVLLSFVIARFRREVEGHGV